MNHFYIQCFLVAICLASYQHALDGDFVFDDTVAIVKNKAVTTLPTNYTAIMLNDFWGIALLSNDSHKSFRPLTTFMFHIEHARLQLGPKHMKLINLLLHCFNTILLYRLVRQINFLDISNEHIASLTAALFAVHPVHTEAVCGIVGRADLIFCLIYLMALLVTVMHGKIYLIMEIMLVTILTAIGIFYKETAITIPLACVYVDYMRRGIMYKPLRNQVTHFLQSRNAVYALNTITLLWFRLWLQNFSSPNFKPMDNPIAFNRDRLTRILSQNYLYAVNLWILLCPQWLSFDWALGCIKLVNNIADLRIQTVLCFYSIVIVMIINYSNNFGPLLALGLLVIPFLPASGIIKVGFVVAERVLYVPSIGYCLLAAYGIIYFHSAMNNKYFIIGVRCLTAMVLLCLLLRTRQRASEWRKEESLFTSALKVCPQNAKVHYNIARIATDQKNKTKAFHHYHKAIELYPEYESALMNLGNLYREEGDLVLAERYIKAAIVALPEFPTAWMNLGIVQSANKKYAEALHSYQQALKYRKNYANCYYNMGNLFLEQQRFADAMQHWQQAIHLNERQPKAWANVLTMLDNRGLHEDALRMSERALTVLPNDSNILFIRANVLGKLKHYVEAEQLYIKAIALDPSNSIYYTNFGVLYHRWGKLNDAIRLYKEAIQLNPHTNTAKENLRKLLERLENGNTK